MDALRRKLLDQIRADQVRNAAHQLTAEERFRKAVALGELADAAADLRKGARSQRRSDEPPELWLRMLAHFRSLRRDER